MRTLVESPPQLVAAGLRRRHRAKLLAFSTGVAVAAGLLGAGTLLAAYAAHLGNPFCGGTPCAGAEPYLDLLPFAALARALILVRRRPWVQRRVRGFFEEVIEGVRDAALGSIALVVFTFFFRSGTQFRGFSFSRLVFLYEWIIATAAFAGFAIFTKWALMNLRRRGHDQRNIVIVGGGEMAEGFLRLVAEHPELGYQVAGVLEPPAEGDGDRFLQSRLLALSHGQRIDKVLLATTNLDRNDLSQLVGLSELGHLQIKALPELFGLPPTKVTLTSMGPTPVLDLLQEPLPGGRRFVKRALDVAVGSAMLALASPLLAVIAVAVRRSSAGPVLLRQERVGMDGRPFRMLKFRTMVDGADPSPHEEFVTALIRGEDPPAESMGGNRAGCGTNGDLVKLVDDPRITPVGRLLRRLSLDELPQLVNVVRGEMSLVGPRPALPYEIEAYRDWHRRRLEVRPGLTGPWQVGGRNRLGFDDMVRLDIEYIEHWSALRDLLIMLKTVPAVFRKETG